MIRVLPFLSRVAFICNICFLAATVILWMPGKLPSDLVSYIVVLGYVLAIAVNAVFFLGYGWLLISGRRPRNFIPLWLIIANFLFFIVQLIFVFK